LNTFVFCGTYEVDAYFELEWTQFAIKIFDRKVSHNISYNE